MKKEEEFRRNVPRQRGKKTVYIKKVTEESGYQIPHLNLIMIIGIIAFVVGMAFMLWFYGTLPKQYLQDIINNGIRVCYIDKCFWWTNCTHLEYTYLDDKLVQFCNTTREINVGRFD